MSLSQLRLENLRCLSAAELALDPGVNLIVGPNGAGKTSLLEAAHLLGRGRSFRSRYTEQLIRHGTSSLWVAGTFGAAAELSSRRLDVRCERGADLRARIDGQLVDSMAALTEVFPVQVIDPGIHRLVEEGPARRRRWLDWAVFHVEPHFLTEWQQYAKALRQRNAALQTGLDPQPWEVELARHGEGLDAVRQQTVASLQPLWTQTLTQLDAPAATLSYERGWSVELSLAAALAKHRERDRQQQRTRYGPHRFEVAVRVDGRPARELVSRGQQKLLGAAMTLVLTRYLTERADRAPTLLLDDPAAELDAPHARALLSAAMQPGAQRIVTALSAEALAQIPVDRVFHVERGAVKSV